MSEGTTAVSAGRTAVEDLLRELAPSVLGALVRRYGDLADAEDAVQEALLAAATQWPPDGPAGDARRRREGMGAVREDDAAAEVADEDDSLRLLFLCCHPALPPGAAIPLTLRAVGGLTTAEIARAFLLPESTIAQRISRAKERIKRSGVAFRMPLRDEWDERLRSVLHVLYLIFNEGYAASSGEGVARSDLSEEAIRLTRGLHRALPDDPEVAGLLALMLLTDARRPARTSASGELVPLAEQDRTRWDRSLIDEGVALITAALPRGPVGAYQVQASIAAVHDEAATTEETDWRQILALYGVLERVLQRTGAAVNPMVELNRAVAVAMVEGPDAGLALLDGLDGPEGGLAGHHRLHAVRAHLLEMAGDVDGAGAQYRAAAGRTTSAAERRYLMRRATRMGLV